MMGIILIYIPAGFAGTVPHLLLISENYEKAGLPAN
jgi:hypothetical protein